MKYTSLATLSFGTDGDIPSGKPVSVADTRDIKAGKLLQADIDGFLELGVLLIPPAAKEKDAEAAAAASASLAAEAAAAEAEAAAKLAAAKTTPDPNAAGNTKTSASGVTAPGAKKEA